MLCGHVLPAAASVRVAGDVRATCVGHNAAITRLCFAPEGDEGAGDAEGACLVSVDSQGCVKMWRIPRALLLPAPT